MDPQQQQQVAAILGPDAAPFESLVSQLMSSSNEQRSHAESLFNLCRDLHPDALAHKLASLLHSSPAFDLRAMSALLLRKLLTYRVGSSASDADLSYLWPRLSPSSQASLKSLLLSALHLETDRSVSKKLSDTISALASSLLPDSAWPELLPFLFHAVSAPDSPRLHESALLIFSQLAFYLADDTSFVGHHLSTLHSILLASLSHPSSSDVRIAALSASVNLIMALESASDRDRLADLLSAMIRTLTESLNSGQEATAQDALELLVELAGVEPRFLRHQLAVVVGAMLQIAEADGLEEGTRHLAIEFIVTLAEARERAPGMMRKLPQFVGRLFAVLMMMLLDIEDDPAWHTAEVLDENAGATSNYGMAQECLDRLSVAMGGNTIVPVASELLPAYLAAPEWQRHHAALITLAQIAEGCSKVLFVDLDHFVLKVGYIHILIKEFVHENVSIQNGKQMVQEGALTALASLADSSRSAQLKPDVTITSVDSDDDIEDSDDERFVLVTITYNSFLFLPSLAMPDLLRSAKLAVEKGVAQGRDESYVKQLSDYIIPALLEALLKVSLNVWSTIVVLYVMLSHELAGAHLIEGHVKMTVDQIKYVMTASAARKKGRAERTKEEDFDDEEGEMLKEENEQEEEVFDRV
ncbi:hypothetical protein BHE74_00035710 [Ensete ventricosum]|nr:hypothetical protein BHE74_00035710 [Ensete ventricosum]